MEKVFYNNQGWVCQRYPYDLEIEDKNQFIVVDEQTYEKTLACSVGKAWRVINGKLEEQVYDQTTVDKSLIEEEISNLKQEIAKAKEDVEQVELFGMVRQDYEQKKQRCVQIVERLRVLEKQLEE